MEKLGDNYLFDVLAALRNLETLNKTKITIKLLEGLLDHEREKWEKENERQNQKDQTKENETNDE